MARASSVTIELNRAGVGALLRSPELQAALNRIGESVAGAARGRGVQVGAPEGSGTEPVPVTVTSAGGGTRVRTTVSIDHPAGLRVEARHRLLVGSLDAARHA